VVPKFLNAANGNETQKCSGEPAMWPHIFLTALQPNFKIATKNWKDALFAI
jgi:hypothetical protein